MKKRSKQSIQIILSVLAGWACLCAVLPRPLSADALSARAANTTVTVVPQFDAIAPGSFWVGVYVELDEGWHTYWRNPGDSGYPVTMEWQLPEGFTVSAPQWPNPHRLDMPPLTSYGYEGETFLLYQITAPRSLSVGEVVTLQAKGSWLSCRVECVPGTGEFSVSLPIAASPQENVTFTTLYDSYKEFYPVENKHWHVNAFATDDTYVLEFKGSENLKAVEFYPDATGIINHAAVQTLSKIKGGYRLSILISLSAASHVDELQGLVVMTPLKQKKYSFTAAAPILAMASPMAPVDGGSLPLAIFFAFLGGLILNVMPCVLPVLSIKVLSLVDTVQKSSGKTLMNGVQFTLGILVSFWFLAFFLVLLKSAGQYVGWGFQFQSPIFVVFMAVLFFWLGLNLFGIFEVGTSLTRIENFVGNSFLLKNHFVNGILATVVATPCTAPFMGSALGFALPRPPIYAYLIFTFLGLGLAFPYLLLSIFPRLLKFVPKPGAWMLVLKKIFGLFFMVTVVWLSWVLGAQRGTSAVVGLYTGLLPIAVGAWIIGRWATLGNPDQIRWRARFIAILFFLAGFGWALKATHVAYVHRAQDKVEGALTWRNYSPELIAQLRADGKPFLIDFTARWCLSCQVNERVALAHPDVVKRILEKGLVLIKGDWTNNDEIITKALAAYGKNSVPVYVLYGAGSADPVFLPEILTPGIVLDALKKI